MNDSTDDDRAPDDDDLERLLVDAGHRPNPPTDASEKAYQALKSDWLEQVEQRKRISRERWRLPAAAAAVVLLVAVTSWLAPPNQVNATWQVELAHGSLSVGQRRFESPHTLELETGDYVLATTPVRLQSTTGVELRMAADSSIRWIDQNNIYLNNGRSYIDTQDQGAFGIDTAYGQVRDIGTRFMVALHTQSLLVAVREGAAEVETASGIATARAEGLQSALLHIDRSGARHSTEPASDARWDWIHTAPSGYTDRAVPMVLGQIGRDLGKRVQYASHGVEATIANHSVQGGLARLHPRQALELVAASAELAWTEGDDTITIDFIR